MFRVGDRVSVISNINIYGLYKNDIYTVTFVNNNGNYFGISEIDNGKATIPLYYSSDFESIRDIRKQKMLNIWNIKSIV